ncbi:MAG: T9SS type A sorting domain-containing protein [Bacteroidota bacterium]
MKIVSNIFAFGLMIALLFPANAISQQTQKKSAQERDLRTFIVRHRLQLDFDPEMDSKNVLDPSNPFSIPNRHKNKSIPVNGMLFPTMQISVIDTAVVISTQDTSRHVFSFNAMAKMSTELIQKVIGSTCVETARNTYSYDAHERMISQLQESWSNEQWVISYRFIYSYDIQGSILSRLEEQWNNGQLVYSSRYSFTYDANEKMLSMLLEEGNNDQWIPNSRYVYTYDANGMRDTVLGGEWFNGQWVTSYRWTDAYDTDGNMIYEFYEELHNGLWGSLDRWTYTYDAKGNMLSESFALWSTNQWVNYGRDTYTYDTQDNVLSDLTELWYGKWVNEYRTSYIYDTNANLTSVWHDEWSGSMWTPGDGYFTQQQDNGGNYYVFGFGYNVNISRSTITTGIVQERMSMPSTYSLSQNYPNPFNPATVINYQLPNDSYVLLSLYNVLGQELRTLVNRTEQPGEKSVQFDASGLSSGIYFYRLDAVSVSDPTKYFSQTRKMLLIR